MEPVGATGSATRVLGVVGTFVLDRIVGLPGRSEPVEDLGGLAYALAAASVCLPRGWTLRPLARVGRDASDRVHDWLVREVAKVAEAPAAGPGGEGERAALETTGLVEVPEPNNRVELRYHDAHDRTEHLTGGVGAWSPEELLERAHGCDALLVNFISGHELHLAGAEELRRSFGGPVYADLHSLFLDTAADGTRRPRALPEWRRWVACFDSVQLNEGEMDRMRGELEADEAARIVLEQGAHLVACTRGSRGAVTWSREGDVRPFLRDRRSPRDAAISRREIPADVVEDADPTGCGDVWGAVLCCRLLAGDGLDTAAEAATRLAGVAAGSRGVTGLAARLERRASGDDGAGGGASEAHQEDEDPTKVDGGGEP